MTACVFFKRGPGLSVADIVALTGAEPHGTAAMDARIDGIAPLETAGPGDLVFMDQPKREADLVSTQAGVCLTGTRFAAKAPPAVNVLVVKNPYSSFVTVAHALFPDALRPSSLFEADGISSGATIHPTARLENGVTVEPGAVIGPRAEIGAGTVIGPLAAIGPETRIGRDCRIGAGAVITHAMIGDRVIVHSGCRIGQDGFGYQPGPKGLRKVPQIGRVIIQDEVEIGANSTIDRGGMRDTVIGEGTKIDNLVQIAHNVVIGRHCIIVSQAGISGSVTIGDRAMLGGQAGIADNLTIGEGAQIAAKSGVMTDVPDGGRWGGAPAMPLREFFRLQVAFQRLADKKTATRDKDQDE
ncbi:MAG: UDP-3-O-(3-hydroxymyristoyl)glucosamine N-acyltransferase [Pseudolabrys sp.]